MRNKVQNGIKSIALVLGILIIPACLLQGVFIILALSNPAPKVEIKPETIELSVNTSEDVLSSNLYSGYVTIAISGTGQIDEKTRHSVFTIFFEDGTVDHFNGFTLDGEVLYWRLDPPIPTPTNRQLHEFTFPYSVGEEPRRLAFRMLNGNEQDTSTFTIVIWPGHRFESYIR
jgi:hypothetical protein